MGKNLTIHIFFKFFCKSDSLRRPRHRRRRRQAKGGACSILARSADGCPFPRVSLQHDLSICTANAKKQLFTRDVSRGIHIHRHPSSERPNAYPPVPCSPHAKVQRDALWLLGGSLTRLHPRLIHTRASRDFSSVRQLRVGLRVIHRELGRRAVEVFLHRGQLPKHLVQETSTTHIWSIGPFIGPLIGPSVHSFVHTHTHTPHLLRRRRRRQPP